MLSITPEKCFRPLIASASLLTALPLSGLPVANDDAYTLNEDEALTITGGGIILSASFEEGSTVLEADWRYLDDLENENGALHTYPVDAGGNLWNSSDFDDSSSTVGSWSTGTAPLRGGAVDFFPLETPDLLQGIGAAVNGQNLVTTYLFRQTFTLTAQQATETNWILENLMDDGGIVYLNGSEIYRTPSIPVDPITTSTLVGLGDEVTPLSSLVDLSGKLVEGANIIAVEVHQNSLISSDVGFWISLVPASSAQTAGFIYSDDMFNGTTQPNFALGHFDASGGFSGGGLFVEVGNQPSGTLATSGGWSQAFSLGSPATATVSFRYRLTFADGYESDEYGEALFEIDGVRYGGDTGNSLKRFYGDGNGGGGEDDSGWQLVSFDIPLSAGDHTISLGAHSSKSTAAGEITRTWFDDIDISIPATGGGVMANDSGDAPSASLVSTSSNGAVSLNPDGSFTYQPSQDFNGADSFTYRLNDATGDSNIATVFLTVNPVNDPPLAQADFFAMTEGATIVHSAPGVIANDSDPENSPLTAILEDDVSNGTLQLNSNGSFSYTPQAGFFGTDTFTYYLNDGSLDSLPVSVSLEVVAINDPPVAVDDNYTTLENTPVHISISSGLEQLVFSSDFNDGSIPPEITGAGTLEDVQGYDGRGPEGNTFSGQFLRNAATGNPAAPITLTLTNLPPHDNISLSFLLAVIDSWDQNNDRLNVTLDGVEIFQKNFRNNRINQEFDYPAGSLILRDEELAFSAGTNAQTESAYDMSRAREFRDIPHTSSTATINFFAAGNTWDGGDDESWALENLKVSLSASPVETLVQQGAVWSFLDDGSDQGVAWRAPGFNDASWDSGPAQLGYGDGDEGTVVEFGPNNNSKYFTTYFRHTFNVVDADEFGSLTLGLLRDDGAAVYLNGTPIAHDNLSPDAAFNTPANANPGITSETTWSEFTIPEGLLVEGSNVLAIEVHQDAPNSSDISMDAYLLGKRATAAGLLFNDHDPENDRLTAEKLSDPLHGDLTFNSDGTFIYTPDVNYEGPDTFTYRVNDGEFNSPPATVTFTITPGANDFPVTTADSYTTPEDTPLIVSIANGLLSNDFDPDSINLATSIDTPPANGSLLLGGQGGFSYTPNLNFSGTDTFTYLVSDGVNTSWPELVTIQISPQNDPPTAAPESYLAAPGQLLVVDVANGVLANDSDPDHPNPTAQLLSTTTSGTLNLALDGSFTYSPNGGFSGADSFTYQANDGELLSAVVTVEIQVNAAPIAINDLYTIAENHPLITDPVTGVLGNDIDSNPMTTILVSGPSSGSLSLNPDGSFIYIPNGNYSGSDSFTYRAFDSFQESNLATATINITGQNDSPQTMDDTYEVEVDQSLIVNAANGTLANDIDIDSPGITASLVTDVTNGTLEFQEDGSFVYLPNAGFIGEDRFTYSATDGSATSGVTEVEIEVFSSKKNIVINEIMFNPISGNDLEEFIELTNIGTTPVSLHNWQFTNGVDFTFPDITLQPGAFLVVVADITTFEATYGALTGIIGNWTGRLSNSGERIRLVDENSEEIDEVKYSDQGEWATRERVTLGGEGGWSWTSDADAGGSSLELINPSLSNKQGQNWSSSLNNSPTPTFANSTASGDTAPLILDVAHFPVIPTSSDSIGIVAELRDEFGESLSATLFYRVSSENPGPFQSAPMADDGYHCDAKPNDGIYGFVHPPVADGTVVEFYIESSDGTNTRTWPAAASNGQNANALLQVDDEANTFDHGFYRIVLPVPEYNQWQSINRGSNAMMNATVILDDGSGPEIRYRSGMRVRGAGSRNHTPPPMRIALPRDTPWNDMTRLNLNTKFTYLQFFGMKLFQASDMRAPDTSRIQVRLNGNNIARNDNFDYGSMVHVQPLSEEYIDDKFENDNDGNLYKKVRPDREFRWLDGDILGYQSDGWSKQTNGNVNDWSDLDELLRVMNTASEEPDYIQQVEAVANVDQWMNWFAAMAILANGETNISNGADDDYSMYRGALDPRFVFVPHDLDTILSIGDGSRREDPSHTIFDMIESGDVLNPLVPFFNHPEIRERYFYALRHLLQTSFSKERFDELLDSHLTGWVPTAQIEQIRNFMDARRIFIEGEISFEIGPPDLLSIATSSDSFTSPRGSLYLNEILAINNTLEIEGEYPDLIELHNSGPNAIPLGGMSLSDDPDNPDRYIFPPGTTIPAGGNLVLRGGISPGVPGLYVGFNLDSRGETLSLYDTVPNGRFLIDSLTFGLQIPDHSIGRTGPDATVWKLCQPTFGSVNLPVPVEFPGLLRLNEWLTQSVEVFEEDFVELYNPSNLPVALGKLRVSDEPVNHPSKHTLPVLSFIAANSFTLLRPMGDDANPARADHLPFKLSAGNEWVTISGENGILIDQVHFVNQAPDLSIGRNPDGSTSYQPLQLATPGESNTAPLVNEALILEGLRITEIMYDPSGGSDLEFIELQNIGGEPLFLGDLEFTEGIEFEFPDMILHPGDFLLVVGNQVAFTNFYGNGLPIAGEYTGKLDNGGERIRLEISDLNAGIHDFEYDDWFPAADGDGFSLEVTNPTLPTTAWHGKENWSPSLSLNGTPGTTGTLSISTPDLQIISLPNTLTITPSVIHGPFHSGALSYQWSALNGPASVSFSHPTQAATELIFSQPGVYQVKFSVEAFDFQRSKTITINVYDTYEAWMDRLLGAEIPGVTGMLDDPDLDGVDNLTEFAFLTNPFQADQDLQPVPSYDRDESALSVTYSKPFVDPAKYHIGAEVTTEFQDWSTDSNELSSEILSEINGVQTIRAVDRTESDSTRTRFMRLRVKVLN